MLRDGVGGLAFVLEVGGGEIGEVTHGRILAAFDEGVLKALQRFVIITLAILHHALPEGITGAGISLRQRAFFSEEFVNLAQGLVSRGYHIISGGTDNHLMLIDLRNKGLNGKRAEAALVAADITVNKNMVPFDTESPFVTSGIRVGTAAITSRGLVATDMAFIAAQIDRVLQAPEDAAVIAQVRHDIHAKMQAYPLHQEMVVA